MKKWIVYADKDSADEDGRMIGMSETYEGALRIYESFKEDVHDTGFTGDEFVHIARIEKSLLPITVYSKDYKSYHFEWEESER
jgi:hypothetical protein